MVIPSGDSATIENAGSSPQIYSSIDSNGFSNVFTLASGGSVTLNAGLTGSGGGGNGTVSGEVWQDSNGNGILDTGESGMSGVTVNLDSPAGQPLMTTITDANGKYQFSVGSSLGSQFVIQVIIPGGYAATIEYAGDPETDSSIDFAGYSAEFSLAAGQAVALNGGVVPAAPGNDVYTWDPAAPKTNVLASNPVNWLLNGKRQDATGTVPGNKPTDVALLNPSSPAITDGNGNSSIEWNQNFTFSTLDIGGTVGYTGQQTIDSNVKVELTGAVEQIAPPSLYVYSNSYLKLYFGNGGAVFQIDANATISNMILSGYPNGSLSIHGGTTYIAQDSGYTDKIGVDIYVAAGATLRDDSNSQLTFSNGNLQIDVLGEMRVFYGAVNGPPLIANGGFAGDYIYVTDGGLLKYLGSGNVKDTLTVPVLVQDGDFLLYSAKGQPAGGTLIVQGIVPNQANNASVYVTGDGTSTVQLSQGATLECDNDYYQESGTLETTDSTTCRLQDDPFGEGTATIAGGSLLIAKGATNFGELDVAASTLNFAGTYAPVIDGGASLGNDVLKVLGNMNIQNTASLSVSVEGELKTKLEWPIIKAINQLQPFNPNNTNEKQLGLKESVTKTYLLTS